MFMGVSEYADFPESHTMHRRGTSSLYSPVTSFLVSSYAIFQNVWYGLGKTRELHTDQKMMTTIKLNLWIKKHVHLPHIGVGIYH